MPTNNLDGAAIMSFLDGDGIPEMPTMPTMPEAPIAEAPKTEVPELPTVEEIKKDEIPVAPLDTEVPITEETESAALTIFNSMQSAFGFELSPEELEGIEITDDLETVTKLAVLSANKKAQIEFNNFFEQNPDLLDAYEYKQAHGSLKGFGEKVSEFEDYSKVDLSDVSNQEAIYRKSLETKGYAKDEIEDLIELSKDKFNLDAKAKAAQKDLIEYEKNREENFKLENKQKIEQKEAERVAIIQEVNRTIDSGKVLGLNLDAKARAEFKEYFTKPVTKEGLTAKEVADNNLTIEQELYIEYLKKTGFKSVAGLTSEVRKAKTLADFVKTNQQGRPAVKTQASGVQERSQSNEIDNKALKEWLES
jgi:hypothetical protein